MNTIQAIQKELTPLDFKCITIEINKLEEMNNVNNDTLSKKYKEILYNYDILTNKYQKLSIECYKLLKKNSNEPDYDLPDKCEEILIDFLYDAISNYDELSFLSAFSFMNEGRDGLYCVCTPRILVLLFNIYVMITKLRNTDDQQFFKPDKLMEHYFSEEIATTLKQQYEKYSGIKIKKEEKIIDLRESDALMNPGEMRSASLPMFVEHLKLKQEKKYISYLTTETLKLFQEYNNILVEFIKKYEAKKETTENS